MARPPSGPPTKWLNLLDIVILHLRMTSYIYDSRSSPFTHQTILQNQPTYKHPYIRTMWIGVVTWQHLFHRFDWSKPHFITFYLPVRLDKNWSGLLFIIPAHVKLIVEWGKHSLERMLYSRRRVDTHSLTNITLITDWTVVPLNSTIIKAINRKSCNLWLHWHVLKSMHTYIEGRLYIY